MEGPRAARDSQLTALAPPATRAVAPFTGWPRHWVRPTGFAWYVSPGVVITQARGSRGSLEASKGATQVIDAVLSILADEVARAEGLLVIHDWRQVTSWDADARRHMMDRVRNDSSRNIRRIVVVMNVSPILGAALQTACMLYSLAGRPMQVVSEVTPALIHHGVQMPGPLPAALASAAR